MSQACFTIPDLPTLTGRARSRHTIKLTAIAARHERRASRARHSVIEAALQHSHALFPPSKRHGQRSSFALPAAARPWLIARRLAATAQAVTLGTFPRPWPSARTLTPSFAVAPFRFRSAALHTLHSTLANIGDRLVSPARQESWICFGYGSRVHEREIEVDPASLCLPKSGDTCCRSQFQSDI